MPSAVEDCQSAVEDRHGSRRRKAKGQRQEIAAAAEDRRVGRPARSTDVHSMHRILGGRPTGRPKSSVCRNPTLCCFGSTDRSTVRGSRSTRRSTDSRVWVKICCSADLGI